MAAKIIDGIKISTEIQEELEERVKILKAKGVTPGLAVVKVGENPASASYVRVKTRKSEQIGIYSKTFEYPEISEEELLLDIEALNRDSRFHGILVQLPLPKSITEIKALNTVHPAKDVDGFHPINMGKLLNGCPEFVPCTVAGIQYLLTRSGHDPKGKRVVIIGAGQVGRPLGALLIQNRPGARAAAVTMVDFEERDLAFHTKKADILIVSVGIAKLITADMVKDGVVVIDVGVNQIGKTADGKRILAGDVDFEAVKEKASAITPVPGGVGPMTVIMLMQNTIQAAESFLGSDLKGR